MRCDKSCRQPLSTLEKEFQRELNVSLGAKLINLGVIRIEHGPRRPYELGMVEGVKDLRAKLQPREFGNPEVLFDPDIPVVRARTKNTVRSGITVHRDLAYYSRRGVGNRLHGRGGEATIVE